MGIRSRYEVLKDQMIIHERIKNGQTHTEQQTDKEKRSQDAQKKDILYVSLLFPFP